MDGTSAAARPWSLRTRLALRLVLALGLVLGALFVVLDLLIDREIYGRLDVGLAVRAEVIGDALRRHGLAASFPEYDANGHTEFFSVYDAAGTLRLTSPNSRGLALSPGAARDGLPRYYDARLPDGHAGRLLATMLPLAPGEDAALLVVGTEREGWDATERRIHRVLEAGIALALMLALALCLWLVREAFGFLAREGRRIERIDADAPPSSDNFPRELQPFVAALDTGVKRLQDAIRRERRFARDVAHELRTPVAEIRAVSEAALEPELPEAQRAALRATVASAERMQRGIDTLLALARIESGQETPAVDPLDLAALARAALDLATPAAQKRNVSLDAALPASAWVLGDAGMLERIAANLIGNAAEYSTGGSHAVCRVWRTPEGWFFGVDNAAPQLVPDDVERFGERFWRKQPEGGTAQHAGLGLALCVALARAAAMPLRFDLADGRLCARLGPLPAV